ncbi:MAG: hypothetical protein AAFV29_06565 [Myxococcota bacterium]
MRYSVAITAALGLLFTSAQAQAFSGFVKDAGAGYAKLSYDTLTSKDLYLTNGERLGFGTEFTQMNLSLYGEVGVTSFLTVGINAPVARFNSFEMSDTAAGLGDIAIFAKAGLNLWGFATAIIVSPEFPTGRDEALVPDGFDGRINLPTGDGEFSTWFRLAVSRSLPGPSWMSSYVSAYGGYNARSKWADQIGAGGELGIGLFGWVLIQGKFDALFSPTPTEDLRPEGIFLFGEGTEYVAAGATISARIPATSLWLDFGFRNTFANLRNLYAGTTFSAGIAADW